MLNQLYYICKKVEAQMAQKDLQLLLCSGKSFAQWDRDRLASNFIGSDENKTHNPVSTTDLYSIHRAEALAYFTNLEQGVTVNWTAAAKQFQVHRRGLLLSNAGQVLKQFVEASGINTDHLNPGVSVASRK